MRSRALIAPLFAVLLLTIAACEREEPAAPVDPAPAPAAPIEVAEPALEEEAEEEEAVAVADEEDEAASPCARGYADRLELEAELAEQLGEDEAAAEPLDREAFMTLCEGLSEQMQNCMTFDYAMRNQPACEAAEASLDAETRAKFDALKDG